jgi:hypothetical protein
MTSGTTVVPTAAETPSQAASSSRTESRDSPSGFAERQRAVYAVEFPARGLVGGNLDTSATLVAALICLQ